MLGYGYMSADPHCFACVKAKWDDTNTRDPSSFEVSVSLVISLCLTLAFTPFVLY